MEIAYFKDIRKVLLDELSTAKHSVKVAVAWFTNHDLYAKLCEKVSNGVEVEVIIIDDYINNGDYGLDFQHFINIGGKLRYGHLDNPMHHKFCIIDNVSLVTGSYNWTYYAESRNEENILLLRGKESLIKQYGEEFERLKSKLSLVNSVVKRTIDEVNTFDYFAVKEYLGHDLYYNGKQRSTVRHVEAAVRLLPNNKVIQEGYKAITQAIIVKKTITSLGIKVIQNGIDGWFRIIIEKGTIVPCLFSRKCITSKDNQTTMTVVTYKGIDSLVANNQQIGSFSIGDLPPKPAGQAGVTVTFNLTEDGILTVTAENNISGSHMKAIYDVDKLVF